VALGVADEFSGTGITANSLWPMTIIESFASINFKMGDRRYWRKASVLSDATLSIISEPDTFNGNMLTDETYLRSKGLNDEDFVAYRCDPNTEPLLLWGGQRSTKGDDRLADKERKANL